MREKLEKKIIERPNDLKRHEAYATWLKENDDPRGQFIDLQIALENKSLSREKRFELESDQQELLDTGTVLDPHIFVSLCSRSGTSIVRRKIAEPMGIVQGTGWVVPIQHDEPYTKVNRGKPNKASLRGAIKGFIEESFSIAVLPIHIREHLDGRGPQSYGGW